MAARHRSRSSRPRHRSEEHTSELQSRLHLVCRLLLEKKKKTSKESDALHQVTADTASRFRQTHSRLPRSTPFPQPTDECRPAMPALDSAHGSHSACAI